MKENQHFTGSLHSQRIEKTKYMLDAKNAECRGDKHVVVVEEGKSKLNDVRHAVERLNPDMAIGFVVNKSVHNDPEGTGYYGYYYAERQDS